MPEESEQVHPYGKEAVKVVKFARKLNKLEAVLKSQTIQWRPQLEPVNSAVVSADSLLPLPPPFTALLKKKNKIGLGLRPQARSQ